MQAIKTRYLGPTDHKGSRCKATADAGSVTIPFDYALSFDQNHKAAAMALMAKLGWDHKIASGTLPCGDGCHVLLT